MKEIKHFINGAFVGSASGKLFDNVSPANGQVIGRVHEAGRAEVDKLRPPRPRPPRLMTSTVVMARSE